MHVRQWARVVAATGVLLLLRVGATAVSAHARVKESVPAKDAVVNTVPTQVVLTFTQETSATQSTGSVVNTAGVTVSTGFKVDLNDRTKMTITLQPSLPNGVYTVKYHTLTEDDNGVVDDTFNFTIQAQVTGTGTPAGSAPAGTTTTGSAASGTAVPTATAAATVTPTTAPTPSATATTAPTPAPTATRAASAVTATGTGGATTLPTTGNPSGGGAVPWLVLIIVIGGAAFAGGLMLRRRTVR